jgi:hypothetical protein
VQLLDAELALRILNVVLDLVDERVGADQRRLDVGVETIVGERKVAALVEVDVHATRVPAAGKGVHVHLRAMLSELMDPASWPGFRVTSGAYCRS